MIKSCCQELIAWASHRYDKWPSHLSTLLPKKEKMFSDDVISKAEGGYGDNAGGHQRASLASLAEITAEGHFLKAVAAIHNGQIFFMLTSPSSSSHKWVTLIRNVAQWTVYWRGSTIILLSHIENARLGFLMMNKLHQDLWCYNSISDHVVLIAQTVLKVHLPSERNISMHM